VFKLAIAMITTAGRPFPTYKRFLPGGTSSWGVMHVVNRIAGGQLLFGPEEKEHFRSLVFSAAHFCGMEVLTWTCLDNHFHLLLNVPSEAEGARLRAEISEEEIFARMKQCYSKAYLKDTQQRLKKFRSSPGEEALAEAIMRRLRAQMYDISAYMHIVQRRFSEWFNKRKGRRGTLWQGRFRSTLVEASGEALLKTAAYIDLNAVRAQIVKDPKDYRWCAYGEAVAGRTDALAGLIAVVRAATNSAESEPMSGPEDLDLYHSWLLELGAPVMDENGELVRPGFEVTDGEGQRKGKLSPPALLGTRVRYFTASLAIGSRAFCEEQFHRYRDAFGPKRQTGARPWRHRDWGGLCGLRDLRRDVIGETG
jgi:REP element-mobilizing transposase RayT